MEKRPGTEWLHPFGPDVTDAVFRTAKSGLAEWKKGIGSDFSDRRAEGIRRSNEMKESIEEGLQEFYDIFL